MGRGSLPLVSAFQKWGDEGWVDFARREPYGGSRRGMMLAGFSTFGLSPWNRTREGLCDGWVVWGG
jgi:hypothetical protein